MVGLNKVRHPIRPGLSSSTWIHPNLNFVHLACSSRVSSPTYHLPTSCSFLAMGPAHCSNRPRHCHHLLRVAEEVIPLCLKLRCLTLLIRAVACGTKPTARHSAGGSGAREWSPE